MENRTIEIDGKTYGVENFNPKESSLDIVGLRVSELPLSEALILPDGLRIVLTDVTELGDGSSTRCLFRYATEQS